MQSLCRVLAFVVPLAFMAVATSAQQPQQSAPVGYGEKTCADWNAAVAADGPELQQMRAWVYGYYSGVAMAKTANGVVLVRPMDIVAEPDYFGTMGRPNVSVRTLPWNEDGLSKLMSTRCSLSPTDRLGDVAAEAIGGLFHKLPTETAANR